MKKSYIIQGISSIIPFFSTIVIAFITMFTLKKNRASKKLWFFFILTFFLLGGVVSFFNSVLKVYSYPVFQIIFSIFVFGAANMAFINCQIKSEKAAKTEEKKVIMLGNYFWLASILFIIFVTGCFLFSMSQMASGKIEDINGSENTNLAVITLDEIISGDTYVAKHLYYSYDGPQSNVSGFRLKELDYQECSHQCKELNGVCTLQATKTSENQMTLNISSKVETGNMEIFIVVDDEIYERVPVGQDCTVELNDIAGKLVLVKIGAESAKMQISVKREIKTGDGLREPF